MKNLTLTAKLDDETISVEIDNGKGSFLKQTTGDIDCNELTDTEIKSDIKISNGRLIINGKDIDDYNTVDILGEHWEDRLVGGKHFNDCEDEKIELGDIVALVKEPYVQSVVEGMYLEEDRVRFSLKYIDHMFSEEEIILVSKK